MQENYKDHQKTGVQDPHEVHPKTNTPETEAMPEKRKEVPPVKHA